MDYQMLLTEQVRVLRDVYETIDSEILQTKIKNKIVELIDLM